MSTFKTSTSLEVGTHKKSTLFMHMLNNVSYKKHRKKLMWKRWKSFLGFIVRIFFSSPFVVIFLSLFIVFLFNFFFICVCGTQVIMAFAWHFFFFAFYLCLIQCLRQNERRRTQNWTKNMKMLLIRCWLKTK